MKKLMSNDGTRIAFERIGSGPALILIDGALAYSKYFGSQALAKELANAFTVITYDRRGRGESGDTLPYSVDREVEDIGALIKEVGGKAYIFGSSSGAALALQAAAHLGAGAVPRVAIYEPPYSSTEQEADAFASYAKQTADLIAANNGEAALELFLSDMMPPEMLQELKQSSEWGLMVSVAPTLAYDNQVLGDSAIPLDMIKAMQNDLLVIDGSETMPFFAEVADKIVAAHSHAKRVTLAGQNHMPQPDVLKPVLVDFLIDERLS